MCTDFYWHIYIFFIIIYQIYILSNFCTLMLFLMLSTEKVLMRKSLVALNVSHRVIFLGVGTIAKPFLISFPPGAAVVGA